MCCTSVHTCICFIRDRARFKNVGSLVDGSDTALFVKRFMTCQTAFWAHCRHRMANSPGRLLLALLLFSVVGRWGPESGGLSSFIQPQMAEPGPEATCSHLLATWQELGEGFYKWGNQKTHRAGLWPKPGFLVGSLLL